MTDYALTQAIRNVEAVLERIEQQLQTIANNSIPAYPPPPIDPLILATAEALVAANNRKIEELKKHAESDS